jgi:hypothetical protein
VNVVEQEASPRPYSPPWDVSFGGRCRARNLIECEGDHVLLQCSKLLNMRLNERKEILEKSGLCLFCLKHAAELECYGRGGLSKPRCTQDGCDGEHTSSVHRLVREESASANFVTEIESGSQDEGGDEDQGWWVGTVGMTEIRENKEEALEEVGESESEEEIYSPASNCARRGELGLGEAIKCPSDDYLTGESEGDGWWSPRARQPAPEVASNEPQGRQLPHPKVIKRRRLRKKEEETRDQEGASQAGCLAEGDAQRQVKQRGRRRQWEIRRVQEVDL